MDKLLFNEVTRIEIIDENGRSYSKHDVEKIQMVFQDNDKTMKIIINE